MYAEIHEVFGDEFANYIKKSSEALPGRLLFIFWNRSRDDLFKFYKLLNDLRKNIQFTIETNEKDLPFFDVLIIMENTNISIDFFKKENR